MHFRLSQTGLTKWDSRRRFVVVVVVVVVLRVTTSPLCGENTSSGSRIGNETDRADAAVVIVVVVIVVSSPALRIGFSFSSIAFFVAEMCLHLVFFS